MLPPLAVALWQIFSFTSATSSTAFTSRVPLFTDPHPPFADKHKTPSPYSSILAS
jgi:hypothetical protein